MKTLVNGKAVEQPHPPSDLSQIIAHAKKLHARNQTLEIGNDRRDTELRDLREALAKERGRFHHLAGVIFGAVLIVFVALVIWALALPHRG